MGYSLIDMTLLENWLNLLEVQNSSANTISTYRGVLERFASHIGKQPENADNSDVIDFLSTYKSVSTRRHHSMVLRSFFKSNKINVDVPVIKREEHLAKFVSLEELVRIATLLEKNERVILFLAATGMRPGEMIYLDKSKFIGSMQKVRVWGEKDKEDRITYIISLSGEKNIRRVNGKKKKVEYICKTDEFVSVDDMVKDFIIHNNVKNEWKKWTSKRREGIHTKIRKKIEESGMDFSDEAKQIRSHDGRHIFASTLLKRGFHAEIIRKLTGWASLEMLKVYTAFGEQEMDDIMKSTMAEFEGHMVEEQDGEVQ